MSGYTPQGNHSMWRGGPRMPRHPGAVGFPRHPRGMPLGRGSRPRGRGWGPPPPHPYPPYPGPPKPRGYFDRDQPADNKGGKLDARTQGQGPNHWNGGVNPGFAGPGPGSMGLHAPPFPPFPGPRHGMMNSPYPPPNEGYQQHNKRKGQEPMAMNQKKKKPKIDSRDLPENNKYVCETCDRGFKTEEKYSEHTAGHVTCRVDGCQYVAAPKLVQLHYDHQHRTGLASKIWKLESKEDIQKWITERKKNFPTKENIEKKKAERAERCARGDVLDNKYFGKMHRGGRGRGRFQRGRGGRGRGRGRGRNGWHDRWEEFEDRIHEPPSSSGVADADTNEPQKLDDSRKETPTTSLLSRDQNLDPLSYLLNGKAESDDEEPAQSSPVTTSNKNAMSSGALGNLASLYAGSQSSEESEEDIEDVKTVCDTSTKCKSLSSTSEERKATDVNQNFVAEKNTKVTQEGRDEENKDTNNSLEKLTNGGVTSEKEPNEAVSLESKPEQQKRDNRQDSRDKVQRRNSRQTPHHLHNRKPQYIPRKRLTLLEKLLAPEIRHERNVILQCVRHIVSKNFFGKRDVGNNRKDPLNSENNQLDNEEDVLPPVEEHIIGKERDKVMERDNLDSAGETIVGTENGPSGVGQSKMENRTLSDEEIWENGLVEGGVK